MIRKIQNTLNNNLKYIDANLSISNVYRNFSQKRTIQHCGEQKVNFALVCPWRPRYFHTVYWHLPSHTAQKRKRKFVSHSLNVKDPSVLPVTVMSCLLQQPWRLIGNKGKNFAVESWWNVKIFITAMVQFAEAAHFWEKRLKQSMKGSTVYMLKECTKTKTIRVFLNHKDLFILLAVTMVHNSNTPPHLTFMYLTLT